MKKINEILDLDGYKNLLCDLLKLSDDEKTQIGDAFSNYNNNKLMPENIKPISISVKLSKSLKNKFEESPKNELLLKYKYQLKKDNNIQICPYCGIDRLDEYFPIEHYLPKTDYPEFTLFGLNLFLCCTNCNSYHKGSKWEVGNRLFLNPYIDELYNKNFIGLELIIKKNVVRHKVFLIEGNLTPEEKTLLKQHFEQFKLDNRLNKLAGDLIKEFLEEIVDYHKEPFLKDVLTIEYKKLEKKYGLNALRTIIHKYFMDNFKDLEKLIDIIDTIEPIFTRDNN